jgi:D-arabinose 1-dehydrogenase-like Zn-dependent alcohol dehydrogenase
VVAPEGIEPAEIAPLCCAGVTLFTAMRNMNARPGDLVAIQGIGYVPVFTMCLRVHSRNRRCRGLGHVGLQFARAMGFRTVALSSGNSKRELALELGADEYINVSEEDAVAALQARGGAHLIVCTVPNADKLGALARGLVVGGTLLLLGLEGALTVPAGVLSMLASREHEVLMQRCAELLVTHRLSLRGWPVGTPQDLTETIEFAKLRGIRSMVQKFPLEKAQEAYDHLATARFRAVIVPGA